MSNIKANENNTKPINENLNLNNAKSTCSLNKTPVQAVVHKLKSNKLVMANKVTYFLGGMGITFSLLYMHFMSYISRGDELIKNEIEEIKKMIEKQNIDNSFRTSKFSQVEEINNGSNHITIITKDIEVKNEAVDLDDSDTTKKNDKI